MAACRGGPPPAPGSVAARSTHGQAAGGAPTVVASKVPVGAIRAVTPPRVSQSAEPCTAFCPQIWTCTTAPGVHALPRTRTVVPTAACPGCALRPGRSAPGAPLAGGDTAKAVANTTAAASARRRYGRITAGLRHRSTRCPRGPRAGGRGVAAPVQARPPTPAANQPGKHEPAEQDGHGQRGQREPGHLDVLALRADLDAVPGGQLDPYRHRFQRRRIVPLNGEFRALAGQDLRDALERPFLDGAAEEPGGPTPGRSGSAAGSPC